MLSAFPIAMRRTQASAIVTRATTSLHLMVILGSFRGNGFIELLSPPATRTLIRILKRSSRVSLTTHLELVSSSSLSPIRRRRHWRPGREGEGDESGSGRRAIDGTQ